MDFFYKKYLSFEIFYIILNPVERDMQSPLLVK